MVRNDDAQDTEDSKELRRAGPPTFPLRRCEAALVGRREGESEERKPLQPRQKWVLVARACDNKDHIR